LENACKNPCNFTGSGCQILERLMKQTAKPDLSLGKNVGASNCWTRQMKISSAIGDLVAPHIKIIYYFAQDFLPPFFPVLDLLVYDLPFFSSTWLPPLISFISSSLPLLLPFYLSHFDSFQPRSILMVVGVLKMRDHRFMHGYSTAF